MNNASATTRPDPVVELLLAQAGELRAPVAVLDDMDAALTWALLARGHTPRVWCDDVRAEELVPDPLLRKATPLLAVEGARTVLWRLPRAVGAVEEYSELIALYASPDVQVVAAGRDKHLSRSMNAALARSFGSVSASLGHRKARALLASEPRAGMLTWPRTTQLDSLNLAVTAHGATFNTNRLDRGTALLISCLDQLPTAGTAIDLGSGSGILATLLARRGLKVHAIDIAWSATDATRLTAQRNARPIDVHRRDGLAGWTIPVDLVVTNPPFHVGAAKDTSPTRAMFRQAEHALRNGGELWCVYNAHLPYLPWLRHAVGPTRIVARDRSYVVARSTRRPPAA